MKTNWQKIKLDAWRRDRYQDWMKFYRGEFKNLFDFRDFVFRCLNDKGNKANLILNNGQRLITFADKAKKLSKDCASFQIMFLIICAETIVGIIDDKPYKRGVSEKNVVRFFNKFFSEDDKLLFNGFFKRSLADDKLFKPEFKFDFEDIIKYLYKIRCQIVHRGVYYDFHWANDDAEMINFIRYEEKKDIIKDDIIDIKRGTNYSKIRPLFIRAIINATKTVL